MMDRDSKLSYPLQWPTGYERTKFRENSMFKQTFDKTQRFLREEISRLRAQNLIVSTNLRTRVDGGIYAGDMDKLIDDPGVAIYFKYKGKEVSLCCDKYRRVWENIYAIAKAIEALRALDRWGVSDFLDRAFTGFTALPPASGGTKEVAWWRVLRWDNKPNPTPGNFSITIAEYKSLAKSYHPDGGGTPEMFQELQRAYDEAKEYFKNAI